MMDIAPGGWRYALLSVALVSPIALVTPKAIPAAILVSVCVLAFYRDPERTPPSSGIVAPADGRVTVVRRADDRLRVGVFMNVTDVHVIRAPLEGCVSAVTHTQGAHRPAFAKSSDRNEQVQIDCGEFSVVLIAGAFARRITPYVSDGDNLDRGQRVGHIAFGSRVDVVLPKTVTKTDLVVERGDTVRAGETILADPAR